MADPILVAKGENACYLNPKMANRHGLIAGATGTGKTVTLQKIAESFSRIGVPVFLADIKGDLSGMSQTGTPSDRISERVKKLGLSDFKFDSCPAIFWDIYREQGHPIRTTISEMGPFLLSRILELNDTQTDTLNVLFKIADENGLLLMDMKDLIETLKYLGDHASELSEDYGKISTVSVQTIQRKLISLEEQGGKIFFGEPALNIMDLIQTDDKNRGVVNVLAADKLMQSPKLYSTFLLWLLSELYEQLPEAGDLDKPKIVFFFDEAHLLFNEAPKALLDKVEQIVRLIRSKGVGVYFITQNPIDIPETILGQLGNRVQHALRAFTPRDQKAVKSAAETFRVNPKIDVETAITELGVGEALVSFLDEKGIPAMVERAFVCPPESQIGAITPEQRKKLIADSIVGSAYNNDIDRESAYEVLKKKADKDAKQEEAQAEVEIQEKQRAKEEREEQRERRPEGKRRTDSVLETVVKSATRGIVPAIGRELVRGLFGNLLGGGRRR